MPRDDLTIDMNARGGRETRREIDKTARATRGVGTSSKAASKDVGFLTRGLTLLGTRMGVIIILGGLMTVALGPTLLASIVLLTAALVTLGAVAGGIFVVGLAVVNRWAETVKSAGSAAWELNQAFQNVKKRFSELTAGGADMVMRSLAKALQILAPLLEQLAPSFNLFAASIAAAIEYGAQTLSTLGPDLASLFIALGPLINQAAVAMGPLADVLISVATAGIPVLRVLIGWIVDLANWLNPTIDRFIAWEQTSHTMWNTLQTFADVVSAGWAYMTDVVHEAWRIWISLYDTLKPFLPVLEDIGKAVGGAFLAGLRTLADIVEGMPPDLRTLLVVTGLVVGVLWALNAAVAANPISMIVIGIVLLIGALTLAYEKVDWFRSAVDWLVQALKDVAAWIQTAFGDAIDFVVPKIMWLIDKIKWIVDKASTVAGVVGTVAKYSPMGVLAQGAGKAADLAGLQHGGTVTQGGAFRVGERGPETVALPAGAAVTPNGAGDVHVHATLVMPDGEVLARQTLRAARRKQSVS